MISRDGKIVKLWKVSLKRKKCKEKGKLSQKPVVNTRIDSWTLQGKKQMRCHCECEVYLNKDENGQF